MEQEEIAFKLVELYVSEVSKSHEKRQMGLDTIMNAYFYALLRIKRKDKEMAALTKAVEAEESAPPEEDEPLGEEEPMEKEPMEEEPLVPKVPPKEHEGPMQQFNFD